MQIDLKVRKHTPAPARPLKVIHEWYSLRSHDLDIENVRLNVEGALSNFPRSRA